MKYKIGELVYYKENSDIRIIIGRGKIARILIYPDKSYYYDIDPQSNGGFYASNISEENIHTQLEKIIDNISYTL